MSFEWEQIFIQHCPKHKCSGMLLSNQEYEYLKCSDCNTKYVKIVDFVEVKK